MIIAKAARRGSEMPVWKLWFHDGSTWTDLQGTGPLIPQKFIQVIRLRDSEGVSTIHGSDYYWLEGGVWMHGDKADEESHQLENAHLITCARRGYTIETAYFRKLLTLATDDPDFD